MLMRLAQFVPPGGCYHIARMTYRPGSVCEPHDHDFAELFLIEDGRGNHHINGRTMSIRGGDLVLMRPADLHGFTVRRGGRFTLVNLAFAVEVIDDLRRRYFGDDPGWIGAGDDMPATWTLGDAARRQVMALTQQLSMQRQRRLDLDAFLLNVFQWITAEPAPATRPQPQWLRDAIADFTAGDEFASGVRGFVQRTGKSPEHVNRTVRQCMACTTTDLVNRIRLDHAAHLLRMTGRPIMNVALDTGFENLSHFYRLFQAHFATTPRRYRHAAHAVAR